MPTTQEIITQVQAGALIAEGLYSALFGRMVFGFISFGFAQDVGITKQATPNPTTTQETITQTTGTTTKENITSVST